MRKSRADYASSEAWLEEVWLRGWCRVYEVDVGVAMTRVGFAVAAEGLAFEEF